MISSLNFTEENYPEVIRIANELHELEERSHSPHESIDFLVREAGQKKIDGIKERKAQSDNTSVVPDKSG